MKKVILAMAFAGLFVVSATPVYATGLVTIPAAGFSGTAYKECFALGQTASNPLNNYGSAGTATASTTANNECAVFPANDATSPVSGYTLVAAANRNVVINNTYTGGTNITVGVVQDRVWRNAAGTSCIYGAKFVPSNVDYQPGVTGTQYFEANDIARAGFSSSGDVLAGYYAPSASFTSVVYRIGRTFTAVQHRALKYDVLANKQLPGTGYLSLPTSGTGASTASINGVNTPIASGTTASATAAEQTAAVNSNWVDFTVDAVYADDDGATNPNSANTYVQAACSSAAPVAVNDAIRVRQTAQELANFIEASVPGFVPPGGTAAPAPTVPF